MNILSTPAALTPERLTDILRQKGLISAAKVVAISYEAIGVGLLGDSFRFSITYDQAEAGAPATIAGKFPPTDATVHASGAEVGVYMNETRFYQDLAPSVSMRVPDCYYAEIDPDTHVFGILFEDMGPARVADQLTGCTRADAELAMIEAAGLHAPRFGDASLWEIDWIKQRLETSEANPIDYVPFAAIFRQRYSDVLEPEYLDVADALAAKAPAFQGARPERFGLLHGDYRLDNMLFDGQGGAVPLVVLDWQTVSPGNPGIDIAYFIGTSYPVELRSCDERDLVRIYHEEMMRLGVTGYDFETLWLDYRRGAWLALLTSVFASAIVKQTKRGDAMFMRMARGAAAQMIEHGTLALA
jgi:Phosphotransferase enzyme family